MHTICAARSLLDAKVLPSRRGMLTYHLCRRGQQAHTSRVRARGVGLRTANQSPATGPLTPAVGGRLSVAYSTLTHHAPSVLAYPCTYIYAAQIQAPLKKGKVLEGHKTSSKPSTLPQEGQGVRQWEEQWSAPSPVSETDQQGAVLHFSSTDHRPWHPHCREIRAIAWQLHRAGDLRCEWNGARG